MPNYTCSILFHSVSQLFTSSVTPDINEAIHLEQSHTINKLNVQVLTVKSVLTVQMYKVCNCCELSVRNLAVGKNGPCFLSKNETWQPSIFPLLITLF